MMTTKPELLALAERLRRDYVDSALANEAAAALTALAATDGADEAVGWGVFGNGGLIETMSTKESAETFARFHFGLPHPDVDVRPLYTAPTPEAGYAAGLEAEWPVGEAQVVIYDPRGDFNPPRAPHKVIDASLAFFDKAEVGDRLYTKGQVEEIIEIAFAVLKQGEPDHG